MNYKRLNIIAVLLLAVFASCTTRYAPEIEKTLTLAGQNREELEEVLKRYAKDPADSLKLRAAEFLIVNMPDKYAQYYDAPWNDVATVHTRWTSMPDRRVAMKAYRLSKPVIEPDVTHITARFLIDNIELAFKVWQEVPWGKDVSFDTFCEEILPYRIGTEPLENWREKALAIYYDMYDALLADSTMTVVKACTRMNSTLPEFKIDRDFPDMNFSQLIASSRGPCEGMTALATFAMRAFGIPVTQEFTAKWPDRKVGHSWNAVNAGKDGYISFMGTETGPGEPHQGNILPKYKAYRKTFGRQVNINAGADDIPAELQSPYMKDVSSEYEGCVDITVPMLFEEDKPTGYAYLAVHVGENWSPVAWGTIGESKIKFTAVGKNLLYLPVYYAGGQQKAANFPFLLEDDGSCRFFRPDTLHKEIVLLGISPDSETYFDYMLHGCFEGANNPDFSDAQLLYRINEVKGGYYHTVGVGNASKFRYVRYIPAGERCDVAELEFYGENAIPLNGVIIGMPFGVGMTRENGFDGDVNTIVSPRNDWVGLDLGESAAIAKIRFLPRSQSRGIYERHTYELSYWDGQQWRALKQQIATGHRLHVSALDNALFRLRYIQPNLMGTYFIMENGEQKWVL